MTEPSSSMSADEAFGRALVARTTFEKEAVWLPSLAVHHMNAGDPVIRGKTFTDCVIEGPAIIAVLDGMMLEGCNLGATDNSRNLLLKPLGDKIVGAIGVADSRFVRCRFVQVGFTGQESYLNEMAGSLIDMAKQGEGA